MFEEGPRCTKVWQHTEKARSRKRAKVLYCDKIDGKLFRGYCAAKERYL